MSYSTPTALLMVLLLAQMFMTQPAAAKVVLWSQHCPRLPAGLPRTLCLNYTSAPSIGTRICAASAWKAADPVSCKHARQAAAHRAAAPGAAAFVSQGTLLTKARSSTADAAHPPADYCSGINDACAAVEARLSRTHLVNVCSPLTEGSDCGSSLLDKADPRCISGMCVGEWQQTLDAVPISLLLSGTGCSELQHSGELLQSVRSSPACTRQH